MLRPIVILEELWKNGCAVEDQSKTPMKSKQTGLYQVCLESEEEEKKRKGKMMRWLPSGVR